MRASGAAILLLLQTARGDVACANERKDSCSLCPYLTEGFIDWDNCAEDCQRNGPNCEPKEVNCGHRRLFECGQCPVSEDGQTTDMSLCQGDCQAKTIGNNEYCEINTEDSTNLSSATAQPVERNTEDSTHLSSTTSQPVLTNSDSTTRMDLLKEITVRVVNTGRRNWPLRIWFKAEVCTGSNGSNCCETAVMFKRAGLYKFSEVFENLGGCRNFSKSPDEEVSIRAIKTETDTPIRTPLKVSKLTAHFGNDCLFIAEKEQTWSWSLGYEPNYVLWGESINATPRQAEVYVTPAPSACPDSNEIACPMENIRVHRELEYARKVCFYQACSSATADHSTLEIGQLGTGGYCLARRAMNPQYSFCCDHEQYFIQLNRTERSGSNGFQRCDIMN